MSDLQRLITPAPGETLADALARFRRFLDAFQPGTDDDEAWKSDFALEIAPATTVGSFGEIEAFHAARGFRMPESLKSFYLEHGAFTIGDPDFHTGMHVFPLTGSPAQSWRTHFRSLMLAEHVMYHLATGMTKDQKRFIDDNYLMFGACYTNDNVHGYLFFDRRGNGFASLHVDQDYSTLDEVQYLFGDPASVCRDSLYGVIEPFIAGIIERIRQGID